MILSNRCNQTIDIATSINRVKPRMINLKSFSHDYSILRRLAFFSLSFYLINIYTNLSFINHI